MARRAFERPIIIFYMRLHEDAATLLIVHSGHKHWHDAYGRPWTQLVLFMKLTGIVSMQIAVEAVWLLTDNEKLSVFTIIYFII